MKILLFADLHSSKPALQWLKKLFIQQRFDLVICPGDIVDRHDPGAKQYLEKLIYICQRAKVSIRVVFGNNESDEIIGLYERYGISLHNKSYDQGSFTFVGIGDIEVHPDRMVDPTTLPIAGNILVTHRPPVINPKFEIRNPKLANAPAIHIAGHIHSDGFIKKLGKTLVINVPAALKGAAGILQLPQKTVQFITEHD